MFDLRYTNDIVLIIWMGFAFFLSKSVTKKKVSVLGCEEERYSLFFAIIVFLPLFWFVTTVFMRGDMYLYMVEYNEFDMSVSEVIQNWNSINKGPGYSLLVAFVKSIGIVDFQQFRVIIAIMHSIPIIMVYWKYSEDYVFSLLLFIANMSYDSWMMNGMRQFLAACIIFAVTPLLLRKKYVLVLIVFIIAISIHRSAIMMIPVFVITQFKPWSKITIILMLFFAIVLYYYVNHSDWMSEESLQEAQGSSPIRILISSVPMVIAFVGRKQIELANNKLINMCVNMSIITVVIFTVSSLTSGIMTGRLVGYTNIYNFLLFPYLCNSVFNESISKNLKLGISLFYVSYFIVDLYYI